MPRSFGLILITLLLLAGCRSAPIAPAPAPPAPPHDSPQPTRLPAPDVQLPATSPSATLPTSPSATLPTSPSATLPTSPSATLPTSPSISLEPAQVLQGDVATLTFDRSVAGEVKVSVTGLSEQPKLFRLDGRPVAFIGFPAAAKPGRYPVKVTWAGGEWAGDLEVVRKKFTEDRLVVTEEQEATYYDPRQEEEWKRLFRLRSTSEERPLWRGAFRVPLAIPLQITTYFGEIRFVNGVETGRHSGMDFGAPAGTPILSPARGKVILAERLIVTGWTLVIDHGMNLFTTYYHADGLDAAPGQWVEAGQQIGRVGSTGFSTGPHLHWTATIGNTPVDPWPLTQAPVLGVLPLAERLPGSLKE